MDDIEIARYYISKYINAKTKGIEFTLSFNEFKRVVTRQTCYYTRIPFNKDVPALFRTLDRIDNTKGYEKGNVVACLHCVNNIKSFIENTNNPLTLTSFRDVLTLSINHINKSKEK